MPLSGDCFAGIVKAAQTTPGAAHLAAPHTLEGGRLGGGRSLYTLYLDAVSLSPQSTRRAEQLRQTHLLKCKVHSALPAALLPAPSALGRRAIVWRDWKEETELSLRRRRLLNSRPHAESANSRAAAHDGEGELPAAAIGGSGDACASERLNAFVLEVFSTEPRRFELLANSVAPGIVGRHVVKAGELFAATKSSRDPYPKNGRLSLWRRRVYVQASSLRCWAECPCTRLRNAR